MTLNGAVDTPTEAPQCPLSPKGLLISCLNDQQLVDETHIWCKQRHSIYPAYGDTLFVARMLYLAGLAVPYAQTAAKMLDILQKIGSWRALSPHKYYPSAGHLLLYIPENPKNPENDTRPRLGFVGKADPKGEFATFVCHESKSVRERIYFLSSPTGSPEEPKEAHWERGVLKIYALLHYG